MEFSTEIYAEVNGERINIGKLVVPLEFQIVEGELKICIKEG